MFYVINVIKVQ